MNIMKKVVGFFGMTFLFILCLHCSFCDSMTLSDNRNYPQVRVDSFSAGTPAASFQIRMITDGRVNDQAFPVPESQIQKIQFNPPNMDASQSIGRQANLVFSDGRRFDGVTVVSFELSPQGGTFMIRQAGAPVTDQAYPVQDSLIAEIQFTGESQVAASPTQDMSSLMPGHIATIPTSTPEGYEESEGPGVVDARFDKILDNMEKNLDAREEELSRRGAGEKMLGNLKIWLISMLISASVGGIVVFLIMKNKGEPVTWGKALLTGLLLATVPGLALKICLYIPICCFNLIVGIMAWFYTARTISMSVLDIQSPTATTIVIVWFIFYILVWIMVAFAIMGAVLMQMLSG